MKLILAIISTDDTKACISALNRASFHVTRLATTGGFLSSGNTTLIIGCEDREVEKAIEIPVFRLLHHESLEAVLKRNIEYARKKRVF